MTRKAKATANSKAAGSRGEAARPAVTGTESNSDGNSNSNGNGEGDGNGEERFFGRVLPHKDESSFRRLVKKQKQKRAIGSGLFGARCEKGGWERQPARQAIPC
jgi:hypothetical protein